MNTDVLYCHQCKKKYNVRKEDVLLMQTHHQNFDGKEYTKGCFFKDLSRIKKSKALKTS